MILRTVFQAFLDALFPPVCVVCQELSDGDHPHCCRACLEAFEAIGSSCCPECGRPFPIAQASHICLQCLTGEGFVALCRSLFYYRGSLPAILSCLKYRKDFCVLDPLVEKMLDASGKLDTFPEADMIVPVPVSRRGLWSRGFNQSALLARFLGKSRGIPVENGVLSRKGSKAQVGLGKKERRRNAQKSFGPGRRIEIVGGKKVLLFDDVYTTGATVAACARILKHSGASVSILTLARRSPEDFQHPGMDQPV
ncbi:MAG: ComF family protein [Proteobacteria bacterium]|nr:ComF family protein [Pseudomonadota bacterium]